MVGSWLSRRLPGHVHPQFGGLHAPARRPDLAANIAAFLRYLDGTVRSGGRSRWINRRPAGERTLLDGVVRHLVGSFDTVPPPGRVPCAALEKHLVYCPLS